ncbi:hypothetical protein ACLOJK_018313 [Asimina triloba]
MVGSAAVDRTGVREQSRAAAKQKCRTHQAHNSKGLADRGEREKGLADLGKEDNGSLEADHDLDKEDDGVGKTAWELRSGQRRQQRVWSFGKMQTKDAEGDGDVAARRKWMRMQGEMVADAQLGEGETDTEIDANAGGDGRRCRGRWSQTEKEEEGRREVGTSTRRLRLGGERRRAATTGSGRGQEAGGDDWGLGGEREEDEIAGSQSRLGFGISDG